MTTLVSFLLTLGVLIIVHEYGHYLAAKRCGVKVLHLVADLHQPLHTATDDDGGDQYPFD